MSLNAPSLDSVMQANLGSTKQNPLVGYFDLHYVFSASDDPQAPHSTSGLCVNSILANSQNPSIINSNLVSLSHRLFSNSTIIVHRLSARPMLPILPILPERDWRCLYFKNQTRA